MPMPTNPISMQFGGIAGLGGFGPSEFFDPRMMGQFDPYQQYGPPQYGPPQYGPPSPADWGFGPAMGDGSSFDPVYGDPEPDFPARTHEFIDANNNINCRD